MMHLRRTSAAVAIALGILGGHSLFLLKMILTWLTLLNEHISMARDKHKLGSLITAASNDFRPGNRIQHPRQRCQPRIASEHRGSLLRKYVLNAIKTLLIASLSFLLNSNATFRAGQPIPDHNVVSRSVEEASAIGGGIANGFSGEGERLMRRDRDHFFRSLKRSMPLTSRAAAAPLKMRGTDHFFRTLRASSPDETNHFFREKSTSMLRTIALYILKNGLPKEGNAHR